MTAEKERVLHVEKQDMGSNPFYAIYLLCNLHSHINLLTAFSGKLILIQSLNPVVVSPAKNLLF